METVDVYWSFADRRKENASALWNIFFLLCKHIAFTKMFITAGQNVFEKNIDKLDPTNSVAAQAGRHSR